MLQQKNKKIILVLGLLLINPLLHAIILNNDPENIIDHPQLLYSFPLAPDNKLNQKITISCKVYTIERLVAEINLVPGLHSKVVQPYPLRLVVSNIALNNITIAELLNHQSGKLGYSWQYINNTVIFRPLKQ